MATHILVELFFAILSPPQYPLVTDLGQEQEYGRMIGADASSCCYFSCRSSLSDKLVSNGQDWSTDDRRNHREVSTMLSVCSYPLLRWWFRPPWYRIGNYSHHQPQPQGGDGCDRCDDDDVTADVGWFPAKTKWIQKIRKPFGFQKIRKPFVQRLWRERGLSRCF